jgi:hypothetical protein
VTAGADSELSKHVRPRRFEAPSPDRSLIRLLLKEEDFERQLAFLGVASNDFARNRGNISLLQLPPCLFVTV